MRRKLMKDVEWPQNQCVYGKRKNNNIIVLLSKSFQYMKSRRFQYEKRKYDVKFGAVLPEQKDCSF